MYKNQLQELAQRSCFNLPSYSCIREGPDHAPRFKATVNFNGETFESPGFCSTLRHAEHAAAEVALSTLATRGPSRALAARVLDETGVYKNLLQETAHRARLNLPVYTTVRSGPGHVPVFSCTVELAGMSFTGEPARTKKQAQKNAAMAAWSSLRRLAQHGSSSSSSAEYKGNEEQEQVIVARVLSSLRPSETRISPEDDHHHGHQRFIPISGKSALPSSSLCPMQFYSWPYPSYSPEMAMYHLWQQEQLLQHQHRLFQLPVSPSSPSPPIFPFVQSVIHPDHCLYFPSIDHDSTSAGPRIMFAGLRPSLCLSDHLVTDPLRGRSTVTIQEIQDDKTEELPVSDPFVLCKGNNESSLRAQEQPVQEDDKRAENHRMVDSRFKPIDSELPNPRAFDSRRPNLRHHPPPLVGSQRSLKPSSASAPPVMIRTVGPNASVGFRPQNAPTTQFHAPARMLMGSPSFPARPMPGRMEFGGVRHSFMAPAVRIRSVVPVCSAPPPREMPGSSRDPPEPKAESKEGDQDNVSKASSELGKMQI